jgi:hypothetical protein
MQDWILESTEEDQAEQKLIVVCYILRLKCSRDAGVNGRAGSLLAKTAMGAGTPKIYHGFQTISCSASDNINIFFKMIFTLDK